MSSVQKNVYSLELYRQCRKNPLYLIFSQLQKWLFTAIIGDDTRHATTAPFCWKRKRDCYNHDINQFSQRLSKFKKKKLFTRMYTLSLSPSHTHTSHKHILSHQTHTRCFHANQKLAHKSFFNTFRGLKRIHTSILVCVWRENERKSA